MTTVVERLRTWQERGGPALWNQAWDRTLRVVGEPLGAHDVAYDGIDVAEGAAGLTVAFYLLAAEYGVEPEAVTAEQVEALYVTGTTHEEHRAAWEERLAALGHDLTDTRDPVVALWLQIAQDHCTGGAAWDETFDFSMTRWGPGYTTGMTKLRKLFDITL